jgi:hypothetical protein
MQPETEKLLREVMIKSMGDSKSVDSFLRSIERIQQIGDSGDIAMTMRVLDFIEQNIPVMQEYLDDDSAAEVFEDMPVGNVFQAVMAVLEMDTLLMAGQMPQLSKARSDLLKVIAVLHAGIKT